MNNNFYENKLVCIARCKNEIHIIKKWYESLPFVDTFVITDNDSTDGTYEYLKSLANVVVVRVSGFNEGRDFQILLNIAKSLNPEWILKMDCDEIFEDSAIKSFSKILNQKKFDSIFFRKFDFDYRVGDENTTIPKHLKMREAALCLTRNNKYINIKDIDIHVGTFLLFNKPVLSNFRIKHFSIPNKIKSQEKYSNYSSVKSKQDIMSDYSNFIIDKENLLKLVNVSHFEIVEKSTLFTLDKYGLDCLFIGNNDFRIIQPVKNKNYYYMKFKLLIFKLIRGFKLSRLFWLIKSKKIKF